MISFKRILVASLLVASATFSMNAETWVPTVELKAAHGFGIRASRSTISLRTNEFGETIITKTREDKGGQIIALTEDGWILAEGKNGQQRRAATDVEIRCIEQYLAQNNLQIPAKFTCNTNNQNTQEEAKYVALQDVVEKDGKKFVSTTGIRFVNKAHQVIAPLKAIAQDKLERSTSAIKQGYANTCECIKEKFASKK